MSRPPGLAGTVYVEAVRAQKRWTPILTSSEPLDLSKRAPPPRETMRCVLLCPSVPPTVAVGVAVLFNRRAHHFSRSYIDMSGCFLLGSALASRVAVEGHPLDHCTSRHRGSALLRIWVFGGGLLVRRKARTQAFSSRTNAAFRDNLHYGVPL